MRFSQPDSIRTGSENRRSTFNGSQDTFWASDIPSSQWKQLGAKFPFYLFVPQAEGLRDEYEGGWKITDAMPVNNTGMVSKRDSLAFQHDKDAVLEVIKDIYNLSTTEIVAKYPLSSWSSRDGKPDFVKKSVVESGLDKSRLVQALYRPFDLRWTYYTPKSKGFIAWPVYDVMRHMLAASNLGLLTTRQTRDKWDAFATRRIAAHKSLSAYDITSLVPLYVFPVADGEKTEQAVLDVETSVWWPAGKDKRKPNFNPAFIADLERRLGLSFVWGGEGDLKKTFGPEDIFEYIYAVFHSPAYRTRYAEFLKIEFPRLPLTSNRALFTALVEKGVELVALHLMESPRLDNLMTTFPEKGSNVVERVTYVTATQRVSINGIQYFEGVPREVWEFHVGGYQVCDKWLKARKGRTLTFDDIQHYQKIVVALKETIRLMTEIDQAIEAHGGWPFK